MIFREKRFVKILDKAMREEIDELKYKLQDKIRDEVERNAMYAARKALHEQTDEQVRQMVEKCAAYFMSEDFLDEIVDRIKRKQI